MVDKETRIMPVRTVRDQPSIVLVIGVRAVERNKILRPRNIGAYATVGKNMDTRRARHAQSYPIRARHCTSDSRPFTFRGCCWQRVRATDDLWTGCPKPQAFWKSNVDFRCVFQRSPPTERDFGSKFFRRCLTVNCVVAEPCWLVTRVVLRVQKQRVSDGGSDVEFDTSGNLDRNDYPTIIVSIGPFIGLVDAPAQSGDRFYVRTYPSFSIPNPTQIQLFPPPPRPSASPYRLQPPQGRSSTGPALPLLLLPEQGPARDLSRPLLPPRPTASNHHREEAAGGPHSPSFSFPRGTRASFAPPTIRRSSQGNPPPSRPCDLNCAAHQIYHHHLVRASFICAAHQIYHHHHHHLVRAAKETPLVHRSTTTLRQVPSFTPSKNMNQLIAGLCIKFQFVI
uniref:Uncharacterized protein n=1 Tax=Ananas comosus var. bracteatus TaxID=296719 RepID=A0A6V7NWW0_ANACO|nr:unnamed protein product [Ananas comosus var. bracteatus]